MTTKKAPRPCRCADKPSLELAPVALEGAGGPPGGWNDHRDQDPMHLSHYALGYLEANAVGDQSGRVQDFAEMAHGDLLQGLGRDSASEAMLGAQALRLHREAILAFERGGRAADASERLGVPAQIAQREDTRARDWHRLATQMMAQGQRALELLGRLQGKVSRQRIEVAHVAVSDGGQVAIGVIGGRNDAR